MIPERILSKIDPNYENTFGQKIEIKSILDALSVSYGSQLGEFWLYCSPAFLRPADNVSLRFLDPVLGRVIEEWHWCQEFLKLSRDFIPLTTAEGGGITVWSNKNGRVYDIEWSQGHALNEGKIPARWASYFELMSYYLCKAG